MDNIIHETMYVNGDTWLIEIGHDKITDEIAKVYFVEENEKAASINITPNRPEPLLNMETVNGYRIPVMVVRRTLDLINNFLKGW